MLNINKSLSSLSFNEINLAENLNFSQLIQAIGKSKVINVSFIHQNLSNEDCKTIVQVTKNSKHLLTLRADSFQLTDEQKNIFDKALTGTNLIEPIYGCRDDSEKYKHIVENENKYEQIIHKLTDFNKNDYKRNLHFLAFLKKASADEELWDMIKKFHLISEACFRFKKEFIFLAPKQQLDFSSEEIKVLYNKIDTILTKVTRENYAFNNFILNTKNLELSHFSLMPAELHTMVSNILTNQPDAPATYGLLQAFTEAINLDEEISQIQNPVINNNTTKVER